MTARSVGPVSERRPTAMDIQHERARARLCAHCIGHEQLYDRSGRDGGERPGTPGNRFPSAPSERDPAFAITFAGTLGTPLCRR